MDVQVFKRQWTLEQAFEHTKEMENKGSAKELQAYINCVDSTSQHPAEAKLQHQFCFAMAYGSATNPALAMKAGALKVVLAAMNRFPQNERLLAEACDCLRNFTEMPDGAEEVYRKGGLQVVLNTLLMNPEADFVQQEGCGLLCRLITECDEARDEAMKRDGLRIILNCIENFPRASWVALWGTQAIQRFAEVDLPRVIESDGFEAVEKVQKSKYFAKPPGCPAVQNATKECLKLRPVDPDDPDD